MASWAEMEEKGGGQIEKIHVTEANKTMTQHKDGYNLGKRNFVSSTVVPEYRYFSMLC